MSTFWSKIRSKWKLWTHQTIPLPDLTDSAENHTPKRAPPSPAEDMFKAIEQGDSSAVKTLLEMGVDPNVPILYNETALTEAAKWHNVRVIKTLLKKADINVKNKVDRTPLMTAVYHGHNATVELLLNRGANPDLIDYNAHTALMIAALKGRRKIARLLVENGAKLDKKNWAGRTALMFAAMKGQNVIVKLLVDAGADLNLEERPAPEASALDYARWNCTPETVELLREAMEEER